MYPTMQLKPYLWLYGSGMFLDDSGQFCMLTDDLDGISQRQALLESPCYIKTVIKVNANYMLMFNFTL